MLIILCGIIIILGTVGLKINKIRRVAENLCMLSTILSIITIGFCVISALSNKEELSRLPEQYQLLQYKIGSGDYVYKNGTVDENLLNEINTYNQNVRDGKSMQYNFWIGNLIPNIYDDLEIINYNDLNDNLDVNDDTDES